MLRGDISGDDQGPERILGVKITGESFVIVHQVGGFSCDELTVQAGDNAAPIPEISKCETVRRVAKYAVGDAGGGG